MMEIATSLEFFFLSSVSEIHQISLRTTQKGRFSYQVVRKKNNSTTLPKYLCLHYFLSMLITDFFSFILGRFAHYDFKKCGIIRKSYCLTLTKTNYLIISVANLSIIPSL